MSSFNFVYRVRQISGSTRVEIPGSFPCRAARIQDADFARVRPGVGSTGEFVEDGLRLLAAEPVGLSQKNERSVYKALSRLLTLQPLWRFFPVRSFLKD